MIGDNYHGIGIIARYLEGRGWATTVRFPDAGLCKDTTDAGRVSTEGELGSRYFVRDGDQMDGLTAAVDAVKADADRLGIKWYDIATVYYEGDGEDPEWPPPAGWRALVNAQAVRLGWEPFYKEHVQRSGDR